MRNRSFAADAAVRRQHRVGMGVFMLACALLLLWLSSGLWSALVERLGSFDDGTEVYRRAQWASTMALAGFVVASCAMVVWLAGRSLRAAFGLPERVTPSALANLIALRVVAATVALFWLWLWASDEIFIRGVTWAPVGSLLLGLFVCANFAWDAPRLFLDARSALRARAGLLAVPEHALSRLPRAGRVHTRGTVVAGPRVLPSTEGPCVYRARTPAPDRGPPPAPSVEVVPFLVESDGAQAIVEVDPRALLVEAHRPDDGDGHEASAPGRDTVVRVGDRIELVATVQGGGGDAYRGSLPALGASDDGPLYLFASGGAMKRRFVFAAIVELACAAGLALCTFALGAGWFCLGALARVDVHHLPR